MSLIQWQSSYETGIELIDNQHKELVALINRLEQVNHSREAESEVQEVLVKLVDYIRYHFAAEEELMAEYQYADVDRHAEIHQHFVKKVAEFLKKLKAGGSISAQELLSFLKTWLIDHIMREDSKLRIFNRTVKVSK